MAPITIYKNPKGEWVTDWMHRVHTVRFNETDGSDFVTLGLLDQPAVRFEVNARGEILGVYNNQTDRPIAEVTFPMNHALHREINIGKPV